MNIYQSIDSALRSGNQYDIIYADPPWMETGGGKIRRGADRHYELMSTRNIIALPVNHLAKPNSHLYLWATNNFLPDALEVIDSWGFNYKTIITWFKGEYDSSLDSCDFQLGLGQYFRGCTEHCLFGVRGNIPYNLDPTTGKRRQGRTGFFERRTTHSTKPLIMYSIIDHVSEFPGSTKLELFARSTRDGWDAIGNELTD